VVVINEIFENKTRKKEEKEANDGLDSKKIVDLYNNDFFDKFRKNAIFSSIQFNIKKYIV